MTEYQAAVSNSFRATARVLYVRTRGGTALTHEELRRRELAGESSRRALVEDMLGFDLMDESDIQDIPGLRGRILRRIPAFLALASEVSRRRKDYDVIVTWTERYSVSVAAALAWRRTRPRHLAMMFWMSKPVVRIPLRVVRRGVDRIFTWSSVQREVAVHRIGFSQEDVILVRHPVDQDFFAPVSAPRDILFSAGQTQRDFATLISAVQDLDERLEIAASHVGVYNGVRSKFTDARDQKLPPNVSIKSMGPTDLRAAYASAKVVVVPLVESDMDAGVSVLLEAMAMGRPVVVSRTTGQVDVVRDGENGLYVSPGDADELRMALLALLADPDAAEAMGARAREYVLAHHRVEVFAEEIRRATLSLMPPVERETTHHRGGKRRAGFWTGMRSIAPIGAGNHE